MIKLRKYWTEQTCKKEALKYKNRSQFKKHAGGAYKFAKKNKILDFICSHMKILGNRFKRLIYVYKFPDNYVYVGLTGNLEERKAKHKRDVDSAVYRHIKKTKLEPIVIYSDYLNVSEAVETEIKTINEYKIKGFKILNKAKGGSIGGANIKWTFERCKDEALKYQTRKEFAINSNSSYNAARRYKWLDKICSHMLILKLSKPINYWSKEKCQKVALKCKTRMIFYKKYGGAYMACLKNDWLNDVCNHMKGKGKKPNNYWSKEKCQEEALKYNSKFLFRKNSNGAYLASKSKGWFEEVCEHMKKNIL